jgi:hypothetical protein
MCNGMGVIGMNPSYSDNNNGASNNQRVPIPTVAVPTSANNQLDASIQL